MLPITETWYVESKNLIIVDGVSQNFIHNELEITKIQGLYFDVESDTKSSGYGHGFSNTGSFYCSTIYVDFMVVGNRLKRNGRILRIISEPIRNSRMGMAYLEVLVEDITKAIEENV